MNTFSSLLRSLSTLSGEFLSGVLFPVSCMGCHRPGIFLCSSCVARIPLRIDHVCPICQKHSSPHGATCFSCRADSPLDGLLLASYYSVPIVRQTIHTFKYRFVRSLSPSFGELLTRQIHQTFLSLPDILIPVPLHSRRLRWRGYNQASLLADHLSTSITPGFSLPISGDVLTRTRHTSSQMSLRNTHDRHSNVAGAFCVTDPALIRGKRIFLIDDIVTTGSTLLSCADVLKSAGAREVYGIAIARQEIR
ncbi:MAG: ComF family protein [Candidatus Moranbacteria bacterium]|nr:ComF family protein [Candidatus Moranbacteria bacterium]